MDEIYKMLGREHQADLDREASKRALASSLPRRPDLTERAVAWLRSRAPSRGAARIGSAEASGSIRPRHAAPGNNR